MEILPRIRVYYRICLLFSIFSHSIVNSRHSREITSNADCGIRDTIKDNQKCLKRCRADQDCVSSRKRCLCDGECGLSCVNPSSKCAILPRKFHHGIIHVTPYNKFGAIANYHCNDGYKLHGIQHRVCRGDETWSGSEPRCRVNDVISETKCGPPPRVHQAQHDQPTNQETFPKSTMLQYTCNEGFSAPAESVHRAWCVGAGVWVGPNMTCTNAGCHILSAIEFGRITYSPSNTIGGRARYTCDDGHQMNGRSDRLCLPDGVWEGWEPSCEKVKCDSPPRVDHASTDSPKGKKTYIAGDQLLYTCNFGYQRQGKQPRAMCQSSGGWVSPEITCRARNCGYPGEVDNGWMDGYEYNYPHRVTYHCNEGYELQGKPYRECQANGEWSGTLPRCEAVECQELSPPLHGTMVGNGRDYGTVVRFFCNDGYKVVGSKDRKCLADRTWSGREAICEEINCGHPGPIANGYLDGHRTTVGAVFYYRCNVYTTFEGGSFNTQCMENGDWSEPPPKCWGQCQIPSINEGKVAMGAEGLYVDHRTVIQFNCENGLHINDTRDVMCVNGSWTYTPRCVPAPCAKPPPSIEHGWRVFMGQSHDDKARYFCRDGYKIDGDEYMQCQYGIWVDNTPTCIEVLCANPGTLDHGQIYKTGKEGKFEFHNYIVTIRHGARLEYECDRDYMLDGPPSGATCINGIWSPSEKPKCVKGTHPLFRKIWRPIQEKANPYASPYK